MRAEQITDPVAHHAEGPVWSEAWGGLRWVDMLAGDVLSLTGEAEVVWEGPELAAFVGAERLLRFRAEEGVLLDNACPLRWTPPEQAPQLAATGSWEEVESLLEDAPYPSA
jgi:sugar lactone lactonase YvrE